MSIDDPNILLKDPEKSRDFLNHVMGTTPEPEPKEADAKHLEGQEVVVHGLKARPELNGRRGQALKWNAETRRIGVQIEGAGKLSVRADNVRLPNADDAAAAREAEAAAAKAAAPNDPDGKALMLSLNSELVELRGALAALDPIRAAEAAEAPEVAPEKEAPLVMLETSHAKGTRAGCAAVEAVTVRPDEIEAVGDAGVARRKAALPTAAGAAALTKVLGTHASDVQVVRQALGALGSLSHANLPGKRELLRAGSAAAAVAAMEAHPKEAVLVAAAARMLANLANGDAECKRGALAAGALPAVVRAMRAHPAELAVQQMACGAVANLANGDGACQRAVTGGGGHKVVAAALLRFPEHLDIQQQGCLALANLAAGGQDKEAAAGREAVVDVGGAAAAVRALRAHAAVPEVRQWALGLLANVASGDGECKQAVADAGGVAALARVLEAHRDDAAVQRVACGALAHVAQDDEARQAVLASAAPGALVGAMRAHVGDAAVQQEACFALVQIAWGGGAAGKRAALDAGAMAALGLVLATHTDPRHQKLQQMARAIMEELDKAR